MINYDKMIVSHVSNKRGKKIGTFVAALHEPSDTVFISVSKAHSKKDVFSKKEGLRIALKRLGTITKFGLLEKMVKEKNRTTLSHELNLNDKVVPELFGGRYQEMPYSMINIFVEDFCPRIKKYFKGKAISNIEIYD